MAAPSKNFTVVADSAIDADSPLTEDVMEDFRDNDIHLEEWLGGSFTAAVDHDHNGLNSKTVAIDTIVAQVPEEDTEVSSTTVVGSATVFTSKFFLTASGTVTISLTANMKRANSSDTILVIARVNSVDIATATATSLSFNYEEGSGTTATLSGAAHHLIKIVIVKTVDVSGSAGKVDGLSASRS